jgi:hypothetical protein
MRSIHSILYTSCSGKISYVEQYISEFSDLLPDYILFANSGSSNRINKSEEIRDESGLGSGAGITPESQPSFADRRSLAASENDASSFTEDDGATGPGSDRTGDKMPGEEGITSLTDGIARFIDDAEEDDSKKRRRKK